MAVVVRALILAGVLLLAGALAFALWSRDSSLQHPQSSGVIRIGYAVEAPYAYVDDRGQVTGWAPELAREITHDLGIERVEWVQVRFADLLPGLEQGHFQVAAAGLFITAERARRVAFSEPLGNVSSGLLVATDHDLPPVSYYELIHQHTDTVAVLRDSVEHQRLLDLGLGAERLLLVPDAHTGHLALKAGRAQVLALSLPTLKAFLAGAPEQFRLLPLVDDGRTPAQDHVAFAFARRDRALRRAWNRAQAQVLQQHTREAP